ncbi:hypothetical protein CHS0354_013797 [Potamilus streckersoni]|uniref:SPARC-related modular calcium-binding protein 1 n=1 Tax=Potamilus streckersoni TaxID=2493646 RepID=A0AAE0VUX8_9BIVA|nr:hypothetical protein CHS0354_013797 [Potamilus streckersoni]
MYRLDWKCICIQAVLFYVIAQTANSLSKSEIQRTGKVLFRALRDSECKVRCKSGKSRPVCGTDAITYQSKCEIKRAKRCEGKNVEIKKRGKCSAKDVPMTKCLQERKESLSTKSHEALGVFVPTCKKDGTFEDVQCHKATGYCWCVTIEGKPIAGTSTSGAPPNCRGKPNYTKRKERKRKKGCSSIERSKFNSNLVQVFTEEYNRSTISTPVPSKMIDDPVIDTLEKRVVEWKFTQLDKDSDSALRRKEVKTLRRMVKKVIKPRACAKQFIKNCDSDNNKLISRKEWSLCLGVDINNPTTPDPGESEEGIDSSISILVNSKPKPSPNLEDCQTERTVAIRQDLEDPEGGIFIPNCTQDGKWARAQCHTSTQYCWCVDENSGRPIAGTSTHKVMPMCDFEAEREMKGCPYVVKRRFLNDLLVRLAEEMAEDAIKRNSSVPTATNEQPLHEAAATWKFKVLDTTNNQGLDREELDKFKNSLKASRKKYTRKCSRNFLRYCDENNDKRISTEEWVDCLGVKKKLSPNLPSNPKRKGRNPFDRFLQES